MDDFKTRIKEKKIQEINLEKTNLKNFINNFNQTQDEKKKKLNELNDTYISLLEIQNNLNDVDDKNTNKEINILEKKIKSKEDELIKNKSTFIKFKESVSDSNNKLNEDDNTFSIKKKDFMNIVKRKNETIEKFENKMNNTEIVKENINRQINDIVSQVRNIKKSFSQNSLNNMQERHKILQENLNNQILKKKILTEKKKLEKNLLDEENIFTNLVDKRKEEKEILKKEYMESINEDNIIEKMSEIEQILRDYDIETKKLIFFSNEKIINLRKKIYRGSEVFNINQNRKVFEKQKQNKLYSEEINQLNDRKRLLNIERQNYQEDYHFLNDTILNYRNELKTLINNMEIEEANFIEKQNNQREVLGNKEKENEELFKKNEKNIQSEIDNYKESIDNLKTNYYNSEKEVQNKKNEIKINAKKILKEISDLKDVMKNKETDFEFQKKKYESRIKYLIGRLQKENQLN